MIYGHGDDIYRYGEKIKINFSSNIYIGADLSGLKAHLASRLDVIDHYPEPEPQRLEELIAERLGIPANMVMVTNGANEAIYLIAQLYSGWTSIIPQPTYNEYADACRACHHTISYENTQELDSLPDDRIYWLCNPNNPTGNVLVKGFMSHLVRTHPRFLYVIDQSYADYTKMALLNPRELTDCYNVMILGSLSKTYCVPGLRLGYLTASPIIISRLREIRQPWSVNALAIEAGRYLLENNCRMLPPLDDYLDDAVRLRRALGEIEGVTVLHSDTTFMLLNIEWATSQEVKQWLIDHYGILVRDASNFYGLDNHYIRIATQRPEQNALFVEAIRACKGEL